MADDRPAEDVTEKLARLEREFADLRSTALARVAVGRVGQFEWWPSASLPAGAFLCNGQTLIRAVHPALLQFAIDHSLLGSLFGVGDGATTFAVPNFPPGTTLVQAGAGFALGAGGGAATATIATANLPAHDHGNSGSHTHPTDTQGAHTHGMFMRLAASEAGGYGLTLTAGFQDRLFVDVAAAGNERFTDSQGSHSHTAQASTHAHTSVGSGAAMSIMGPWRAGNWVVWG